jgi:cytochrome c oxidase subunit I
LTTGPYDYGVSKERVETESVLTPQTESVL